MATITQMIKEFIADFKLESGSIICFNAIIDFTSKTNAFQLPTEIQIITAGGMSIDTIYLLGPDIVRYKIPDIFPVVGETFLYKKKPGITDKRDIVNLQRLYNVDLSSAK